MATDTLIRTTILESLGALAAAREYTATHPQGCTPIIEGITHCASCGFSYLTQRHVVEHRNLCATPHKHPEA